MCLDKTCLHDYKVLSRDNFFNNVGKTTHRAIGEGYLCLAVCTKGDAQPSHFMVHSYHTPTIPITILSPGRTVLWHSTLFGTHTVYTNHVTGKGYAQFHVISGNKYTQIPGIIRGVLVYAQAVRPSPVMPACHPFMRECTHSLGAQSVACASKIHMGVDCAYRAIRHLADWRLCCVHRTHTQPSALCSLYSSRTSHASPSHLSLLVICNAYDRFTFSRRRWLFTLFCISSLGISTLSAPALHRY
jgi:hypothetical protein